MLIPIRSLVATASVVAVAVAPSPAGAQAPPPPPPERTITAIGTASLRPTPENPRSSDSIRAAVRAARATVLTSAFARGRARAQELATQAQLPLGALLSVAEGMGGAPYFFPGPFGEEGTFGPGRYCGNVTRAIVRRDAQGRRRVTGRRTTRSCRIPTVSVSVTLTFAAA